MMNALICTKETRKKAAQMKPLNLTMCVWKTVQVILGITIDNNLTFNSHINILDILLDKSNEINI